VKPILFFCFLVVLRTTTFCQTGKLAGSVTDAETKTPLELATITIFGQDSSIVAYSLSDKIGKFTVEKLPLKKNLLVSVTYTGYIGYNKTIQLNTARTDTISVFLSLNNKDSNAIVVTAIIPIRMNGDTLEINPAAFKLKQDAVVEELLNQVSGITIWSDGTITVNGKKVESLLVDGKPFMGSTDARVATQNLPKSAIEKIQLYQEYDRSKIGQVSTPQDSLLTMNIQLKEGSKKGYFGKAGAGYGTSNRFESDLSFQMYDKKSSAGIGGGFNNINKNIGNLQEMFQNNTYRNYNPNLYSVGRFEASGINKNHSLGAAYTHNFIETANSRQNNRISINYNKSGTDAYITDLNLQNRTTISNPQFIRGEGTQNNRGDRHDLGINYIRTNSYNDNLSLNSAVNTSNNRGISSSYTEVRDTSNQLQSTNSSDSKQSRRSDNESLTLSFAKSNEEPLKNFNVQLNARRGNSESERKTTSIFKSFTDMSKSSSYNRRYLTSARSLNISGNLDYSGFKRLLLGRYNLFGISLNLNQWFNYTRFTDNNVVGDYDSASKKYIDNSDLSNLNKRELLEYMPSLGLSKSIFKFSDVYNRNISGQFKLSEELKTEKNISSFAKRNLTRSFEFLRYEGSLNYSYQKRQAYRYFLSAAFVRNFDYPSIDQLYTIVDDINVYSIRIGNPNLRNRINRNINLNASFNTQNPKSVYKINSNISAIYTRALHPVTDSIINDFSGKRTYYYINADKNKNLNLSYNFNISRKFNKNNLQLMYNGQFSNGKTPNYIDGIYNISETGNLTNRFSIQYSLRTLLLLNVGQSFQRYKTEQTASKLTSFKNRNNSTNFGVVLNYPNNFTFSSTVDRIDNSNLKKQTLLWNSFLTYRFMKQQGELKFSAMDLLKQYQNISNSVSSYGTTTRITNGLQQYFLLTFSYYPRKFGKTEIKKQAR
jgi:hypothetical protein